MRIGRTLPPAAAPIGWKSLFSGISAVFRGESEPNRFSDELKEYFGKSHCFLVSSGKAALTLILIALKEQYPERNEVIIPAYTCYSVPSAIVRAGLKIKLCDTAAGSFDFDFKQLKPLLKSKKLLCVVPTHLFGLPADVKLLKEMISDPEVTVVEDAAQAMGGEWQGEKLGTLGDVSFFSLGRGKAFSTVEGGIILTDSEELATNLKLQVDGILDYTRFEAFQLFLYAIALNILLHPTMFWIPKSLPFLRLGETIFSPDFEIKKMSFFQSGLSQNWQRRIEQFYLMRRRIVQEWLSLLQNLQQKHFIQGQNGSQNLIRFPWKIDSLHVRQQLIAASEGMGLGITKTYPDSIDRIPVLASEFAGEKYPVAKELAGKTLTLPVHSLMKLRDIEKIKRAISDVVKIEVES